MPYLTAMRNKTKLLELAYESSVLYASALPGEQYHPDYQKNKNVFRLVVKSDRQMEKKMAEYLKGLAGRLANQINWINYTNSLKAFDLKRFIDADWDGETLLLKVIITEALKDALIAGGNLTEEDLNIDIGWNGTSKPALDFLNKYSLKLAKDLTDTTVKKVKASIETSIDNGEDQQQAVKRLMDIIDDPKRAATIAHTESVRAFSQGRLAVAEEVGADRKQWKTTFNPCPICQPLDGDIVKLDKSFENEIDAPPAHPNCRCIIRILMKDQK